MQAPISQKISEFDYNPALEIWERRDQQIRDGRDKPGHHAFNGKKAQVANGL
jgi:hypothetical protein